MCISIGASLFGVDWDLYRHFLKFATAGRVYVRLLHTYRSPPQAMIGQMKSEAKESETIRKDLSSTASFVRLLKK